MGKFLKSKLWIFVNDLFETNGKFNCYKNLIKIDLKCSRTLELLIFY